MDTAVSEKRQYKRIFFSLRDRFGCRYRLDGESRELSALILNVSLGGICLKIDRSRNIRKGAHLLVGDVVAPSALMFISNQKTEIKYIIADRYDGQTSDYGLEKVVIGCEFTDLTPGIRDHLLQFMQTWVLERVG
jgi:hypothetical protein